MPASLETTRHTFAHLLAAAVRKLYPDVQFGIGPAIENGFYYDFLFSSPISDQDLKKIQKEMKKFPKTPLTHRKVSLEEARKLFSDQPFKLELIADLEQSGESQVSLYEGPGDFVDLCAGPHLESTSQLPLDAFLLDRLSGAYWKGDENNIQMTRLYGLAFASKEELDTFLQNREEALKRDHRKLGKELNLFHIDDKVGLGLPLWHPRGAIIWRMIEDFWYQSHLQADYQLVRTPHIGNKTLWETSGHWGFYNDSMYPPLDASQTLEQRQQGQTNKQPEEYLLKPMNCPFHVQIYKAQPYSYRDLPLRWAECGTVYRFEKKGELSGLTRVRGFTQDDAHIICRADQVEDELKRVVDFILFIFKSFGFDLSTIRVYLSLRDPANKDKYAGSDAGWELTESTLRKVAQEKKLPIVEEEGEAAFYGPKLDFKINDVLGREWQCSTLQFDFNLPERFDMTYTNSQGQDERPYVLHRALFGSFERFIGLLLEHYAGALPTWLAPVQAAILPIADAHLEAARTLQAELKKNNLRVDLLEPDETLGKRVRLAEKQKIPYLLILGDKEIDSQSVTVRRRGQDEQQTLLITDFIKQLQKEVTERA